MSGTVIINGTPVAAPEGAIAYKYNDPIEDARWIYDEDDLQAIAAEDPSLIVRVTHTMGTATIIINGNELRPIAAEDPSLIVRVER